MISKTQRKQIRRQARVRRIKARVRGTLVRPRLVASRTNTGMYVQLINDETGKTLISLWDRKLKGKNKTERAKLAGSKVAELALKKGIKAAVFDRAGRAYHGRVAAVAQGARAAGLKL
ncbi:MAG: 50S ribosomal protein L18 [Parcubacteria group bacterium]